MTSAGPSSGENGISTVRSSVRRRLSMEEDLHYQHIMASPLRRPSNPPGYDLDDAQFNSSHDLDGQIHTPPYEYLEQDNLPDYSTAIQIEGVFSKKHEIEETTRRAEDRQWHTVRVALVGTALNIYKVKKDWGWGKSRDGPSISPDNPPWIKKAKLEKSYNLTHADAGIAADYHKRRYVIRIRAETDQFLLACVELETFVKWLELLFAAIDITAPLDDRDFPRDMSIPRVQRIRWFRNISPSRDEHSEPTPDEPNNDTSGDQGSRGRERQSSLSHSIKSTRAHTQPAIRHERIPEPEPPASIEHEAEFADGLDGSHNEQVIESDNDEEGNDRHDAPHPPPRIDPMHRLSTTSYPNLAIDPFSGKWFPEHKWSSAHDLLYAKLCYSNLLFRSPRKSNYIIQEGKQWYVDWTTGRMVRVLPPHYSEINDFFGPWQVIHTENRRI